MRHRCPLTLLLTLLLISCAGESGPPIVISQVRIFAPIPGSTTGVAYMMITNSADQPVTISSASSPQFDSVAMHETTIVDGVSRMRPLENVRLNAGDVVEFKSGGKHFMLSGPRRGTAPGLPVTIEIQHDNGLLIVSATMQTRMPAE